MSKTKFIDIAIEKYCFQPYETSLFALYVLRKCGEALETLEEEVAYKFVENDEIFESWISSKFEKELQEGVVRATIDYYDKTYSTIFFKEPKADSGFFAIPIPYLAKLLKIVVLKDVSDGEISIKEEGNGFAIDFSHDDFYVFFNPIKMLDSFAGLIVVTNVGIEHIRPSDLVKISEGVAKRKKKSKSRKRKRRARKRKSKKGKG